MVKTCHWFPISCFLQHQPARVGANIHSNLSRLYIQELFKTFHFHFMNIYIIQCMEQSKLIVFVQDSTSNKTDFRPSFSRHQIFSLVLLEQSSHNGSVLRMGQFFIILRFMPPYKCNFEGKVLKIYA